MNAQQRIESVTALAINRVAGVLITLLPRNVSVWANIDRVNRPPNKMQSEIVIQGEVGITAYIMKRHLNLPPKKGEYILEANGDTHTIGTVKDLGQRWQVECSSEPL